jgi:hypothetical protein
MSNGETGRVVKRKQVRLPGGGTVDVPVITQITFKDPVNRGQEAQYAVDNSAQANRDVHVAAILDDGSTDESAGANNTNTDALQVERIDLWRVKDPVDRGQQTHIAPDSKTVAEPPDAPPYFTTHKKTHIVRYINTPDDGSFIDSELIDEFRIKDPVNRGQQTWYTLQNPPDNQNIDGITIGDPVDGTDDGNGNPIYQIQVDPTLDDVSDTANGVDPPWRLDPFQNIVSGGGGISAFVWSPQYFGAPEVDYINTQNFDQNQFSLLTSYDMAARKPVPDPMGSPLTLIPMGMHDCSGVFSSSGALWTLVGERTDTSGPGTQLWTVRDAADENAPHAFWLDNPPYTNPPFTETDQGDNPVVILTGPFQGYDWTRGQVSSWMLTVTMPGGSPSWTKTFSFGDPTNPNRISLFWTTGNNLLIQVSNSSTGPGLLTEYDTSGAPANISGQDLRGITDAVYVDPQGNIYDGGGSSTMHGGSGSGVLTKYDKLGNKLWQNADSNLLSNSSNPNSFSQTSFPILGGKTIYLIAGGRDNNGDSAYIVQGIDPQYGTIKWTSPFVPIFSSRTLTDTNGPYQVNGTHNGDICVDPAGNVYGSTSGAGAGFEGSGDIFQYFSSYIFSYDENGNQRFMTELVEGVTTIDISKDNIGISFFSGGQSTDGTGSGNTANPAYEYGGHEIFQLQKDGHNNYVLPPEASAQYSNITYTTPDFGLLPVDNWQSFLQKGHRPFGSEQMAAAQPQKSTSRF